MKVKVKIQEEHEVELPQVFRHGFQFVKLAGDRFSIINEWQDGTYSFTGHLNMECIGGYISNGVEPISDAEWEAVKENAINYIKTL